ncbi:hypothetical protein C9J43_12000 [Photobacterium sp. GB-3]|nr:hypothetical protein C9J43_12000 [Photobacterium sp. GB-3]
MSDVINSSYKNNMNRYSYFENNEGANLVTPTEPSPISLNEIFYYYDGFVIHVKNSSIKHRRG